MDNDSLWAAILVSPLKTVYLSELHGLAVSVVGTVEEVFNEVSIPPRGQSYLRVDQVLMRKLFFLLGDAARIKGLLTQRQRREDQSNEDYGIHVRRTTWLRKEILKGVQLNRIFQAGVRNSLEHFESTSTPPLSATRLVDG